ncbi:MAG: threonine aldolase [Methanofollis sp.]|nr:threonine aldolase [Methanofollis sp.]
MKIVSFFDEDCAGGNREGSPPPGSDSSQPELFSRIRNHFEGDVSPFYVPDRNTALALALAASAEKNSMYLCSGTSYAAGRGCASINRVVGMAPLAVPSQFGKLDPEAIETSLRSLQERERLRCTIVSIAQPTEYGLVYTPGEIEEICLCAHECNMLVLMDGSRLFFAAAHLLKAFREQTLFAGVDVATFGGAKNGVGGGEAVLVFRREISEKFPSLLTGMNIDLSGAEAFSSGFDRLLTFRLWRKRAVHANEMAADLSAALSEVRGIRPVCSVETNKVVAEVTPDVLRRLKRDYSLRTFGCPGHTVRFVTNYTTSSEDIARLMSVLR